MKVRNLDGMSYKSAEVEHPVATPMTEVLQSLVDHLRKNKEVGLLTGVFTYSHPEDEDKFITSLVWSV